MFTGIVSVQIGAAIAIRLFTQIPPAAVTSVRLWTAAVILAAATARGLTTAVAGIVRHRAWRDAAVVTGFGLSLAVMNYCIYQSFARIPLGVAVTIELLGPLGVAVASSRRMLDLAWVALATGGTLLVRTGLAHTGPPTATHGAATHGAATHGAAVTGLLYALAAAAAWAAYILLSRSTGRRFPGPAGLSIAMIIAAVMVTPTGVAAGGSALLRPTVLATGAVVGLLSSIIPYSLELKALRRVPARVFGIWMSAEPVAAALAGLVILGQALVIGQWLAVVCVTLACLGAERSAKEPLEPQV